jgi:flagellar hook-basal body complex protein FliE
MSLLGPVTSAISALPLIRPEQLPGSPTPGGASPAAAPGTGFAGMLDNLVGQVGAKQAQADELTRQVLTGQSGQLHQSVIAMQEASVAFSLMVQVRNKLVDSYQELMRMQV